MSPCQVRERSSHRVHQGDEIIRDLASAASAARKGCSARPTHVRGNGTIVRLFHGASGGPKYYHVSQHIECIFTIRRGPLGMGLTLPGSGHKGGPDES